MTPIRSTPLRHIVPPVPLDRREIKILILLGLVAFSQGWAGNVLTHTLAFTRVTFGLSDARIADVQAIVRGVALLALVFSWWSDHRGRRGPLLVAFVILPVANLFTVLSDSLATFAGWQSITRIGTVALGALALVVLAEEIEPEVRGYAAAVFALFLSMGTGWGLLLSSIAERGDEAWRWLFGLSSVTLLVFPFLAVHLKESRAFRPGTPRPPLGAVLHRGLARFFWPMALLSFAISAFTGPAANFILPRMVNDLGWDQGPASVLLVITSTPAVVVGLLVGGRAADLIGRKPAEFVSMLVGVVGGLAFYWFENGWVLGLGIFGSVLGASAFSPAYSAQRAELFPTEVRATAGAWTVNASITGGLFGFLAGRFVIDAWGLSATISLLGGLVLASTLMLVLLPETRGADLVGDQTDLPGLPGAMPM